MTKRSTAPGGGRRKNMILSALLASLLAVTAPIALPLPGSTVPLTLTTLLLFLLSALFPFKTALSAVFLYLCMGAVGLPVFAGGLGGLGVFVSPSGGFLAGYLFLVLCQGLLQESFCRVLSRKRNSLPLFFRGISMLAGLFVLYLSGAMGLVFVGGISFPTALSAGALPYLLPDLLKLLLALFLLKPLFRGLDKAGLAEMPRRNL